MYAKFKILHLACLSLICSAALTRSVRRARPSICFADPTAFFSKLFTDFRWETEKHNASSGSTAVEGKKIKGIGWSREIDNLSCAFIPFVRFFLEDKGKPLEDFNKYITIIMKKTNTTSKKNNTISIPHTWIDHFY